MLVNRFMSTPLPSRDGFFVNVETGLVWHRTFQRVPYADTDRANVVYHANYLRYFEVGRTELLRAAGYAYSRIEGDGYLFPVVRVELRYLRSLGYDDPAWIYTRPAEAEDRVHFTFSYAVCHAETMETMCIGSSTHCTLGARGRPIAMEPHVAALWRDFPTSAQPLPNR
jgi:acyl-CoA thioester hydrolase